MLNDTSVASAGSYIRTCRRIRNSKKIATIRDFHQNICVNPTTLLGGLSSTDLDRLQKLQNRSARLIYQVNKRNSATPLIRELHWLPVEQRIKFKISVHVYNCVYGSSPVYLQDLISKYNSGRQGLRSNRDQTRLAIPKTKRAFGDKSFAVFGQKYGIVCQLTCVKPLMCNVSKNS